ncbi:hypothetical protein L6452_34598 [Arctium lappa]|uniref:Uncharacterized protein n=2 Tax=Arctium lappa TaxID=4217 RepID=A0ACB8YMV5_ARCLA|nr:hypothetical protein L6452_34587 [Arctium lappa]KAI3685356.1 hypothetical protein L6452_34598 [Arctium lappa]
MKQLLYVESTECENMRAEHMRSATLGWSFDSLKKRESSELDAGDLGSATMKPISKQTSMGIGTYDYDIKYGSNGTEDFGGPSNTINVAEDEDKSRTLVLSQSHDNQVSQFWFTPTLHKDKGKGVCLEDEGSLKKAKKLDESYHEFAAIERGQVAVISTHLRSPYVRRVVDMKVSAEDKRVHEWAHGSLGGIFDTVVILDNGAKLIRRDLETMARSGQVSQKVVDMWAEVLNYEEKYRNRD